MKVQIHSDAVKPGEVSQRIAKKVAHAAGLTDLTLNRNGVWVAYNAQLDLVKVTPLAVKYIAE